MALAVQVHFEADRAYVRRQQRRRDPLAEAAADAEDAADELVGEEAGAARIDAPAAFGRDGAVAGPVPLGAGAVAVGEGGVAAAEVGVALPGRGVGQPLGDGDRVGDRKGLG